MAKQKKDPKKPLHAAFKFSEYDVKHRRQILQAALKVEQLYNAAIQQVANRAASMIGDEDPAAEFRWQDFPSLNKAAEELLDKLNKGLQANLEGTMRDAWDLANAKNDAFVSQLAKTIAIPEALLATWRQPNITALETLTRRIAKGMNLSNGSGERTGVWNLAQFKEELELTLQVCMGKGMSAAEMARKVKQYLKYPDKLFRRVRDENGVLRLSKAAKAFHPGAGVYRSSYKNALRLTATENNIAYRTADHERWQQMDFVLGQHVHLSQNHTLNNKPFFDICDELSGSATDMDDPRGRYPKDFKFTGWHPFCRCYVTPIMVSQEEMAAWAEARRNGEEYEFKEKPITEMPQEFVEKMQGMDERIAKAEERGTLPYFMRDNQDRMAQVLGRPIVVKAAEPVSTKRLTPALQAATIRHANRTADEVADIKRRAKERQELHQRIKDDAVETLAIAKRKRVRLNGLEQAIADGNLDAMRGYADGLRLRIQAHNEQVQKAWDERRELLRQIELSAERSKPLIPAVDTYTNEYRGRIFKSPYHGTTEYKENLRIGKVIADEMHKTVYMMPNLNADTEEQKIFRFSMVPAGFKPIKNADYMFDGEIWEAKSLLKIEADTLVHNAIQGRLKYAFQQAPNAVIEVSAKDARFTKEAIDNAIEGYFNKKRFEKTLTPHKVIVVQGSKVYTYKNGSV